MVLRQGQNQREVPLSAFYVDYMRNVMAPGEWVERIRVPLPDATLLPRAPKPGRSCLQGFKAPRQRHFRRAPPLPCNPRAPPSWPPAWHGAAWLPQQNEHRWPRLPWWPPFGRKATFATGPSRSNPRLQPADRPASQRPTPPAPGRQLAGTLLAGNPARRPSGCRTSSSLASASCGSRNMSAGRPTPHESAHLHVQGQAT